MRRLTILRRRDQRAVRCESWVWRREIRVARHEVIIHGCDGKNATG